MISLVLNVGLKNARCIAFRTEGEILSQSTREVHTLVSNNFVEQDPAEWISHSMTVITDVVKELGSSANEIKAITVTNTIQYSSFIINWTLPFYDKGRLSNSYSGDE